MRTAITLLVALGVSGLQADVVMKKAGSTRVLEPVRMARAWTMDTYTPFADPQQLDTLIVDDGTPYGRGANGDPSWKEAVKLPVSTDCVLKELLFYPGDVYMCAPPLHWYVWDDDGSGGKPGTPLADGIETGLIYDNWFSVDVSSLNITLNPGSVYVGWSDEDMIDSSDWYWNYFDTALNWYNWWYNGSAWVLDDFFSGDFLIRAVVDLTDVEETSGNKMGSVEVYPNPSRGTVNFALPAGTLGEIKIYDVSGRLVESSKWVNKASFELGTGVYFYRVVNSGSVRTGTLTVE
ncbi:MAG: T9SS type A sorting domain-containing protein [candidate division WOR-3 bacterium]